MKENAANSRPPITDNPWFWLYLFGTAGLVGVMLLNTKFDARQAGFDANFTRRQELLEQRATGTLATDREPNVQESEPRYVTFIVLYAVVALGTAAAWFMLWRQHFHGTTQTPVTVDRSQKDAT
jgi:hypothetical protein